MNLKSNIVIVFFYNIYIKIEEWYFRLEMLFKKKEEDGPELFSGETALDFLVYLRGQNISISSKTNVGKAATNSELRRWLNDGAIEINGKRPKADDIIKFPITSLVFFPKSNSNRRTIV